MKVKLPLEIERFAQEYFAAEARATRAWKGVTFRKVDQKAIALRFKALVESGEVEFMKQLAMDLEAYKPGVHYTGHITRLKTFAKSNGIKVPLKMGGWRGGVLSNTFDFKTVVADGITRAMKSGLSLKVVQAQVNEVMEETAHRVQVTEVTPRIQALLRETGLTASQLAVIANRL